MLRIECSCFLVALRLSFELIVQELDILEWKDIFHNVSHAFSGSIE
jgi:hypothetical protein